MLFVHPKLCSHSPLSSRTNSAVPCCSIKHSIKAMAHRHFDFMAAPAGTAPPVETDGRLVYYSHTLCPYAERVWLALLEKQVPFHLCHLDLSNKPSWYRSVNPAGLVPAVGYQGTTYTESSDIIAWLDQEFPDNGTDLSRKYDHKALKQALSAGSKVTSAGLDLVSGNGRYWGISTGQSKQQIQSFESALKSLFQYQQQHHHTFLVGDQPSLADIAVYPFIKRFAIILPGLCGYNVHDALDGVVGKWIDAMDARPSAQVSSPDEKLFNKAARKHGSLDFFDYDTYTVFQLHPHNVDSYGEQY